jgi:hypothetical protein
MQWTLDRSHVHKVRHREIMWMLVCLCIGSRRLSYTASLQQLLCQYECMKRVRLVATQLSVVTSHEVKMQVKLQKVERGTSRSTLRSGLGRVDYRSQDLAESTTADLAESTA